MKLEDENRNLKYENTNLRYKAFTLSNTIDTLKNVINKMANFVYHLVADMNLKSLLVVKRRIRKKTTVLFFRLSF